MEDLPIRPGLVIPARDLEWTAVRASGPGGQNVNKVATKVVLRFDLPKSAALDERTKSRLRILAGRRGLDSEGRVVVSCQAWRERERNLSEARSRLAELVRTALVRPRRRRPTAPTAAAKRRRRELKRRRGELKRARGRVGVE